MAKKSDRLGHKCASVADHVAQPSDATLLLGVVLFMATPRHKLQRILSSHQGATWVLTGDSITQGALHTSGWRSYPEHFMERVRWELRRKSDTVINTGTSGDTTDGLLRHLEHLVLRFSPDVTSIMIGMNDCLSGRKGREDFRRNLLGLVDAIEAKASLPLLHTTNPVCSSADNLRKDLPHYVEIIREVAIQRKIMLVDHYDHWITQDQKQPDVFRRWLDPDGVHPDARGHCELAKLFFVKLGIFDPASPTGTLCTKGPVTERSNRHGLDVATST